MPVVRLLSLAVLLLCCAPAIWAGDNSCQAGPSIAADLEKLRISGFATPENRARQKKVINELLAQHPDELFVHLANLSLIQPATEAQSGRCC